MCGLFGAIGQNFDSAILRALALCNRSRGTDSYGLFDASGAIYKRAIDPLYALAQEDCQKYVASAVASSWFLAGHTRYATQGAVKQKNAHPFKYGNVIGAHNGCVSAPKGYRVDSMYIFDRLSQCGEDYQTALAPIDGYWALTWFDGTSFWMSAFGGEVSLALVGAVWYYSSEVKHLRASVGCKIEPLTVSDGATYRFSQGSIAPELMPVFTSAVAPRVKASSYVWTTTSKSTNGTKSTSSGLQASRNMLGDWDYGDTMDWLSANDWQAADDSAMAYGYSGLCEFMRIERIHSEVDAARELLGKDWQPGNDKRTSKSKRS